MTSQTVKDRLLHYLESQNIPKTVFCREMGLSPAYVTAMRKSLPEEKVKRMCEIYPNLNRDWLLYGEGEMLQTPVANESKHRFADCIIPLLPVDAYAGGLQNYSRGVGMSDCDMIAVPVRGADFAINITGDSMEPEIHSGCLAAIKRINASDFIPWGNPLVIDTENGVLIKLVYPSEKGDDYIKARSYNPKYPDIQIPKSCVYGLYRVLAYINTNVTM